MLPERDIITHMPAGHVHIRIRTKGEYHVARPGLEHQGAGGDPGRIEMAGGTWHRVGGRAAPGLPSEGARMGWGHGCSLRSKMPSDTRVSLCQRVRQEKRFEGHGSDIPKIL